MKIQRCANRRSSARASKRCRRFLSAICMSEVMTKWHSLIEAASWQNCWSWKNLFTICGERRSAKEDGAQEPEHIDICEDSEHRPTQAHGRAVRSKTGSKSRPPLFFYISSIYSCPTRPCQNPGNRRPLLIFSGCI